MAYYYQIGGDINSAASIRLLSKWQTTDLEKLSKNTCMNMDNIGFQKSGSKRLNKDDNEAMFIPKGYAILGYDHDNCKETGNGAQFFHGYHTSRAANDKARTAANIISGYRTPGGVYSYYGPNGGNAEDQPRDLAKKLSSWKVYDLNRSIDFKELMAGLESVDTGSISANKDSYKKTFVKM